MGDREGTVGVKGVGRGSPKPVLVTVVLGTVGLETVVGNVLRFWRRGVLGLADLEGSGVLGVWGVRVLGFESNKLVEL